LIDRGLKKGGRMMYSLPRTKAIISSVIKDGRLYDLYDRWQDEKEYEEFDDYIENAKHFIEKFNGLEFIKMSKNFKVIVKHKDTLVEIKITRTHIDVSYK
jgi:hypothetical protein